MKSELRVANCRLLIVNPSWSLYFTLYYSLFTTVINSRDPLVAKTGAGWGMAFAATSGLETSFQEFFSRNRRDTSWACMA